MQSKAKTVKEYLDSLPQEKREVVEKVRKIILENVPKGMEEGIQWGMISYFVPLSKFPSGYGYDKKTPLPFVSVASQKNYYSIYMMFFYGNEKLNSWFLDEYKKSGKKLDMGKGCLRFKKLEDLNLDLIGKLLATLTVDEFISSYENARKK